VSYVYRPAVGKPLTPKETEVFELVLAGNSLKGVARIVGVAQDTVKTHVGRIRCKLGAKNNEQAAVIYSMQKVKEQI
jgi:DNA-binding CsgD family transcriptional regulator